MKKIPARHSLPLSSAGFSLIELAMGMAIVGIILGGALLTGGRFFELDRREETRQYLRETKSALLIFAKKNGRLPMMDTAANAITYGDGFENKIPDNPVDPFNLSDNPAYNYPGNIFGWVPFTDIGIRSEDPYRKRVQYFVNWQLAKEGAKPCQALKNLLSGKLAAPRIPFAGGSNPSWSFYNQQKSWTPPQSTTTWFPQLFIKESTLRFPVAAVLISAAQDNIFNSNNLTAHRVTMYFEIKEQEFKKDVPPFDDIGEYISLAEAYEVLNCQ